MAWGTYLQITGLQFKIHQTNSGAFKYIYIFFFNQREIAARVSASISRIWRASRLSSQPTAVFHLHLLPTQRKEISFPICWWPLLLGLIKKNSICWKETAEMSKLEKSLGKYVESKTKSLKNSACALLLIPKQKQKRKSQAVWWISPGFSHSKIFGCNIPTKYAVDGTCCNNRNGGKKAPPLKRTLQKTQRSKPWNRDTSLLDLH